MTATRDKTDLGFFAFADAAFSRKYSGNLLAVHSKLMGLVLEVRPKGDVGLAKVVAGRRFFANA